MRTTMVMMFPKTPSMAQIMAHQAAAMEATSPIMTSVPS